MNSSLAWKAILILLFVGGVLLALNASEGFFSELFTDDSYYYFLTARNISHGLGVTFDGINETNGFHPLWMVILLPVFGIFDGDALTPLRVVLIVQVLLFLVAAASARRLLARRFGHYAAWLGCAALLMPPVLNFFFNGLETGLLLAAMMLLLERVEAGRWLSLDAGPRSDVLLGLGLALVSLCRLDAAFLAVGLNLAFLLLALGQGGDSFRRAMLKALRVTAAYALLIAPYLIWNQLQFGHLMPISSVLKTGFPAINPDVARLLNPQRLLYLAFAGGAVFLPLLGLILSNRLTRDELAPSRDGDREADLSLGLTLAVLVHLLNTVLFMDWAVYWWHFVGYTPLILYWVAFLGRQIGDRAPAALRLLLLLLLVVGGLGLKGLELRTMKSSYHHNWLTVAHWTAENTPEDTVFGMLDCGLFAWYSGRPVVNLDGVINGFELQEAVHEGRLGQYLKDCGVDAIAKHNVEYLDGEYRLYVQSRLYPDDRRFALQFTPEDEIYRSEPLAWVSSFRGSPPLKHFVIWRLPEDLGPVIIER